MIQARKHQCFAPKTLARFFVGERVRSQNFQGNIAIEALVAGAVHHSHATSPDLLHDPVLTQDFSDA